MARQKKPEEPGLSAPFYMGTYGDMVTLILCFFILLFAMSSVDSQKFQKALISLRGSLGVLRGGETSEEAQETRQGGETQRSPGSSPHVELDTRHVAYTINSFLRAEGLEKSIQVTINQRGVAVSISDQFLFASGSAEIRPEGQRALYKIAELTRDKVPAVAIEGHTDSSPMRGGLYRDNWGLSSMRAAVVASYFERIGRFDPVKIQAVGFGSSQPVVPNDSPEHQALNRRVELVFLSEYPKR
ncbi:MAG: flagellar motor protein MotB [Synergistaceae bacterium]|nr:flagellar motor protein MotB [Synergistaceae bacterium]